MKRLWLMMVVLIVTQNDLWAMGRNPDAQREDSSSRTATSPQRNPNSVSSGQGQTTYTSDNGIQPPLKPESPNVNNSGVGNSGTRMRGDTSPSSQPPSSNINSSPSSSR